MHPRQRSHLTATTFGSHKDSVMLTESLLNSAKATTSGPQLRRRADNCGAVATFPELQSFLPVNRLSLAAARHTSGLVMTTTRHCPVYDHRIKQQVVRSRNPSLFNELPLLPPRRGRGSVVASGKWSHWTSIQRLSPFCALGSPPSNAACEGSALCYNLQELSSASPGFVSTVNVL